jgi:cyclopropane-fatty-acyl-phospholipid synthase
MIAAELVHLAATGRDDSPLRKLIRFGLAGRDAALARRTEAEETAFAAGLDKFPMALATDAANRQHYEVPAAFFETVLGPRLTYSCCFWPDAATDLGAAEEAMLDLIIARADLADGQRILDLGCGWGALSLSLATRFPHSEIVGLSNSRSQCAFIAHRARPFPNLTPVCGNITSWQPDRPFDRIVSIEMFEHMRNLGQLMRRLAGWIKPAGRMFVHVFCHAERSYLFEDDITAQHFFTGGMMPARSLLPRFQTPLFLKQQWALDGTHYQRTAEAWLAGLDRATEAAGRALAEGDDPRLVAEQIASWRLFFLITAESFGFKAGARWMVAHYLFEQPS